MISKNGYFRIGIVALLFYATPQLANAYVFFNGYQKVPPYSAQFNPYNKNNPNHAYNPANNPYEKKSVRNGPALYAPGQISNWQGQMATEPFTYHNPNINNNYLRNTATPYGAKNPFNPYNKQQSIYVNNFYSRPNCYSDPRLVCGSPSVAVRPFVNMHPLINPYQPVGNSFNAGSPLNPYQYRGYGGK